MNKLGIKLYPDGIHRIGGIHQTINSIKHIKISNTHKYKTINYNKFGIQIIKARVINRSRFGINLRIKFKTDE